MRRTLTLALIAGALILTPLAIRADTITENFTVPVASGTTLPAELIPSGLALFNPADGTLTGIDVHLSGSATWTSSYSSPVLLAYIDFFTTTLTSNSQTFTSPGTISIDLTGRSSSITGFGIFSGTGDYNGDLLALSTVSQFETGDTLTASTPIAGTITYDYTPATPTTTPEPASLLLFGTGLIGLVYFVRRREKRGAVEL